ncbi:MAG TPA: hypothetical protein VIL74_13525 [Pyrinomonadaceae bacterium]|jgi:hypothetical protein
MSCFNKVSTVDVNADPDLTKHVNYTSGMILGVDDFTQEFAYLAGRDRWLARDALGYGTVSGLRVQIDVEGGKGARVMVLPGTALSPRGHLICVSTAQCAYLNEWLAANRDELAESTDTVLTSPPITSPPLGDEVTLYVVLCYRDCPVDQVPIPGEPCRSEEELMAPSRIQDDFSLELRLAAPPQPEEDAVREFAVWLREIKVVETGASTPLDDFKAALRARWTPPASAPTSPPLIVSPPLDLQINAADAVEYLRTAFRLWTTELRSVLTGRKTGCAVEMTGGEGIEDCVLLAALRVPLVTVSTGVKVSDSEDVSIDEEKRPLLLHLRMLQEWLFGDFSNLSSTPVTSPPPAPTTPLALDDLTDVEIVNATEDGQALVFEGGKWINKRPETGGAGTGVTDHGELSGLADDDHAQYFLADGARAMQGTLDAGGFAVVNLKPAEANGEAVTFEQAIKRGDDAGGDLSGKYPNPTVSKLAGVNVDANPSDGQVLTFRTDRWIAADLPAAPTTGGVTDHGNLSGLGDDDHPQYLLIDGARAMSGNLNLGGGQITNLSAATADDQAVIFQQAVKNGDAAGGDLTGAYPNPTISLLQGNPLQAGAPNAGDMLVWNGASWSPQAQPQIPTPNENKPKLILPLATITRIDNNNYEIWFNIDAPGNLASVVRFREANLRILDETDGPSPFTTPVRCRIQPRIRNVFIASLIPPGDQREPDRMRFNFDIREIGVEVTTADGNVESMPLFEYAEKNNIGFAGFLEGRMVTVFVRGSGISG